jgi:dephospho-CoA kinase
MSEVQKKKGIAMIVVGMAGSGKTTFVQVNNSKQYIKMFRNIHKQHSSINQKYKQTKRE